MYFLLFAALEYTLDNWLFLNPNVQHYSSPYLFRKIVSTLSFRLCLSLFLFVCLSVSIPLGLSSQNLFYQEYLTSFPSFHSLVKIYFLQESFMS